MSAAEPTAVPSLSDIDLSNLDSFVNGAPWDDFDRLRRDAPVHWNAEPPPNHGFWSITCHADVLAVDRDAATFSSERGAVGLEELDAEQLESRKSMIDMDGVRHAALRRLLQGDFTPRSLDGYKSFLRGLTATTLDAALEKGEFDFVTEVSADFPIRVLARLLLGTGRRHRPAHPLGKQDVRQYRPGLHRRPRRLAREREVPPAPVSQPGRTGGLRLRPAARPRTPGRHRHGSGEQARQPDAPRRIPLSDRDFDNYFVLLMVAGNETTRHAISHSMLALATNRDQFFLLKERPQLITVAVEEFLRWSTPIYRFRRTAMRDLEMHGEKIRDGDKVVMWFAAANRDENVFEDPYRFNVTRSPNDHLTFGKGGPHFCLGAWLARLELRVMFEELLARVDDVELTGTVAHVRSNFINGIKSMPVRVSPA